MSYDVSITAIKDAAFIDVRAARSVSSITTLCEQQLHSVTGVDAIISLGNRHCLIRTTRLLEDDCLQQTLDALGTDGFITANTDHYTGVALKGRDCSDVLTQASAVDFERLTDGHTTRCRFARTAAIVHVIDQYRHYEVFVETSYATYLSEWLSAAAMTQAE